MFAAVEREGKMRRQVVADVTGKTLKGASEKWWTSRPAS